MQGMKMKLLSDYFLFFKEKKILRFFIGQKIINNYYVNSYTYYTSYVYF